MLCLLLIYDFQYFARRSTYPLRWSVKKRKVTARKTSTPSPCLAYVRQMRPGRGGSPCPSIFSLVHPPWFVKSNLHNQHKSGLTQGPLLRLLVGNAFMHSADGTDESVPYAAQCQFRVIPSGTKWSRGIFVFGFGFSDLQGEDPSVWLRSG